MYIEGTLIKVGTDYCSEPLYPFKYVIMTELKGKVYFYSKDKDREERVFVKLYIERNPTTGNNICK